jgi:hypothetical protein
MGYTTELNGIQIQRLKQKLSTRTPTAELELKGVRAYMIGEEGRGTTEIAIVLNIARIHNAILSAFGAVGCISRAFARCRKVGQKPLHSKASYVRTLAKMHAGYRENMLFTFFVSALLGVVEQHQHAYLPRVRNQPDCTVEAHTGSKQGGTFASAADASGEGRHSEEGNCGARRVYGEPGRGWLFGERGHAVQHHKTVSRYECVKYLRRDDECDDTRCVEGDLWKTK